jgi:pyridoxamine 5'-phosphate oxidase
VSLRDRRVQYESAGLRRADLDADPVRQWRRWYDEAEGAGVTEPNAMTLSTIGADGGPDSRVVLARGFDERGVAFYSNRDSTKGAQLAGQGRVSLVFAWLDLHRQVRIRGAASVLPDAESDAYFASRPRGSQEGAWASPQSSLIASRDELERMAAEAAARFAGRDVPRPDWWGGWLVRPESFEFWQGRPNRLHDRFRYERNADGWSIARLAP